MAREIINELFIVDKTDNRLQLVLSYGWDRKTAEVPVALLEVNGIDIQLSIPLFWEDLSRLNGAVKRAIKQERESD